MGEVAKESKKIQIFLMVRTITQKTKCKAKEKPKDALPPGTEERRELVPLSW
jgi:hypothetical protein